MSLKTEFEFSLPRGYVAESGQVHTTGRMRLATALDEIELLQDPRVQANEAYLPVLLLSRVIEQLGELTAVTPQVIEGLFASDIAYLEELYQWVNSPEHIRLGAVCPQCNTRFQLQIAPLEDAEI